MFVGEKSGLLSTATALFTSPWDHKPRAEMDDSQSRLLHSWRYLKLFAYKEIAKPLSEVLHHPTLYNAYPMLADVPVEFDRTSRNCHTSYERKDAPSITLGISLDYLSEQSHVPLDTRRDALHEIQHIIQLQEGFARGSTMVGEEVAVRLKHIKRLANLMNGDGAHDDRQAEKIDRIREGRSAYEVAIRQQAARRYHYAPGEIEARDTEDRADLTLTQRIAKPTALQSVAILGPRAIFRKFARPNYSAVPMAAKLVAKAVKPARSFTTPNPPQ